MIPQSVIFLQPASKYGMIGKTCPRRWNVVNLGNLQERFRKEKEKVVSGVNTTGTTYDKVKSVIGVIVMVLYRLRKVFLAIPVVYYALKLASYNMHHLPELVGINLQTNGAFADTISREMAVMGPLGVTAACLVLMFCSRRALYPWAISIFTLVLPVLVLFSNQYPM